jgi:tetratricopeptide (TPR) repeat protein
LCCALAIGSASLQARSALPAWSDGWLFAAATEPAASPNPAPRARHGSSQAAGAATDQGIEDDAFRSSAKDLQLSLDGERKADAAARFMHGLMLEDSSDADRALDEYLKALALDPANVDLSIKLAWEYLRRDDTPAAINLLKDTIKAAPKQAEPPLALAYLYFNTLNKNDLAQKYATQALEIDPNNIYSYQYLMNSRKPMLSLPRRSLAAATMRTSWKRSPISTWRRSNLRMRSRCTSMSSRSMPLAIWRAKTWRVVTLRPTRNNWPRRPWKT